LCGLHISSVNPHTWSTDQNTWFTVMWLFSLPPLSLPALIFQSRHLSYRCCRHLFHHPDAISPRPPTLGMSPHPRLLGVCVAAPRCRASQGSRLSTVGRPPHSPRPLSAARDATLTVASLPLMPSRLRPSTAARTRCRPTLDRRSPATLPHHGPPACCPILDRRPPGPHRCLASVPDGCGRHACHIIPCFPRSPMTNVI
jgi:hypothetical protein